MSNTYDCVHFHIVFSTKNRAPFLNPAIRDRVHEYMGGIVRALNCVPDAIGGTADHVHLLLGIGISQNVPNCIRDLKKAATKWIRAEYAIRDFSWQDGYAAFSVSESLVPVVIKYILNQEKHHRKMSSREEYIELLTRHNVRFEERFVK